MNLPREENKLIITYYTFEKASFDEFLIASLISNEKDAQNRIDFIEQLTDGGSLNNHFEIMLRKMQVRSADELKKIIDTSALPITKKEVINIKYYPALNCCTAGGKNYEGDLVGNEEVHKKFIRGEYVSSNVEKSKEINEPDVYRINFNDRDAKIFIGNDFVDITQEALEEYMINDLVDIENYPGTIHDKIEGDNWKLLNQQFAQTIVRARNKFVDGDCYLVQNDNIKHVVVGTFFGLYFYKEEFINYTPANRKYCEKAMEIFVNNKLFQEFKTYTLIKILECMPDYKGKDTIINDILAVKESPELAMVGWKDYKNGVKNVWGLNALNQFKKCAISNEELATLYSQTTSFLYSLDEKSRVHKTNNKLLTPDDLVEVNDYVNNKSKLQGEIINMIGQITASGIRQRVKSLGNRTDTKTFSKLANDLIGHEQHDMNKFSLDELQNRLTKVTTMYDLYLKLNKELNEQEKGN
ncbi:MAG: hypothetical protein LBV22_02975 [Mycoplasmataceae bacterium]|nr:hypothetical protein [Mycoplasmataceae bacterium]